MWREGYTFLKNDHNLNKLIKIYGPCDIKKRSPDDYFHSLVRSISGQQLSVKAASTIFSRVENLLDGDFSPSNILLIDSDIYRKAGLSYKKVEYVKDLASKIENNKLKISNLDELDNEKIVYELTSVRGIGVWTAKMFLMFTLARPDVFPVEDLGIRNAFKKLIDENASNVEMIRYSKKWSPWRTVASWYLWRSLDNTL